MSTNAMIVRSADVQALVGSKYYTTRKNGIVFATDGNGALLPIPKEDVYALIDTLDHFNQAWGWWVGDTGCAIQEQFGEDELNAFFQKIHFDPTQGRKYMSISRTYGWPNKIEEMRHSDPQVSHRHHQLATASKDAKQRMSWLEIAAKKKMTAADFYEFVQLKKAGPGASDPGDDSEYSVFRPPFRAYDKKVDNPEQFLQEFFDHVRTVDFPAYLDPKIAEAQRVQAQRVKAVESLSEPRKSEILNDTTLDLDGVRKAVKAEKAQSNVGDQIKAWAKKVITDKTIADATERAKQIELLVTAAATENDTLATFKARVSEFKKAHKAREGAVKTIEKMAEKLRDVTKRQELIDRAHAENMTVEDFEPIIKSALTDQYVQDDADRVKAENERRLAAVDPTKAAKEVEKLFAKKAAKPKADDSGLALKKSAGKKKGAAAKSRGKK